MRRYNIHTCTLFTHSRTFTCVHKNTETQIERKTNERGNRKEFLSTQETANAKKTKKKQVPTDFFMRCRQEHNEDLFLLPSGGVDSNMAGNACRGSWAWEAASAVEGDTFFSAPAPARATAMAVWTSG